MQLLLLELLNTFSNYSRCINIQIVQFHDSAEQIELISMYNMTWIFISGKSLISFTGENSFFFFTVQQVFNYIFHISKDKFFIKYF